MSIDYLTIVLKKLKIHNYIRVNMQYSGCDYDSFIRNDYNKHHLDIFTKESIYNYNNIEYLICYYKSKVIIENLEYIKHEIAIRINNYISNEIVDLSPVIHITIYKDNIAYLKNITYLKKYTGTFFNYTDEGINLFEASLQFLKENKNEFDTNEIRVFDNSVFYNIKNNDMMPLSLYHTLLYGETFYNKYGFITVDKYDLFESKYNKEIIEKTKICNTTLFKYIFKVIKNRKNRIDFYNKFSNLTIKEFFNKFYNECFIDTFKYHDMHDFSNNVRIHDLKYTWMKLDLN